MAQLISRLSVHFLYKGKYLREVIYATSLSLDGYIEASLGDQS